MADINAVQNNIVQRKEKKSLQQLMPRVMDVVSENELPKNLKTILGYK